MKVVLGADLEGLGRKGDVVEVTAGYARNYLLPKRLALPASKGTLREAEWMRRSRELKESREHAAAEDLASRIGNARLVIAARAGEDGQLFGSITTSDVAEQLRRVLGEDIDRRRIHLPDPVRSLGVHEFSVPLQPDVVARGTIEVIPQN
ncbi:MAG: 50S ribosomal protein L9 [Actinomycetota bacterium]